MKKTKIICTMGPNTNDAGLMRRLVQNGMDIARFNFSHGDHEEQKSRMDMLKKIREEEKKPVAILLDTKGPEIRTGVLKGGKKVSLDAGDKLIIKRKLNVLERTFSFVIGGIFHFFVVISCCISFQLEINGCTLYYYLNNKTYMIVILYLLIYKSKE